MQVEQGFAADFVPKSKWNICDFRQLARKPSTPLSVRFDPVELRKAISQKCLPFVPADLTQIVMDYFLRPGLISSRKIIRLVLKHSFKNLKQVCDIKIMGSRLARNNDVYLVGKIEYRVCSACGTMSDELEQDMEIYLLYIDRTPGLKVSENFWTIISCDVIPKSVPLLKGYFDPIIP